MTAGRKIVLIGPMGAGKTSLGRRLATRLRWEFTDTDHALCARTGVDIPTIFAAEGEAVVVVACCGFEFVHDAVDTCRQGVVDARADAGSSVVAERVGCPAHGFEFLCVLQQGVFGQPYAGQDKTAEVLAVAVNDIEGDGRAAADDAERLVGEPACAEHGKVAIAAEQGGIFVGNGEGVVGFFLRGEDVYRFAPQVVGNGGNVVNDVAVFDAAHGDAFRFGQEVPGAPQFGAPVFAVGRRFDDARHTAAVEPFDAGIARVDQEIHD